MPKKRNDPLTSDMKDLAARYVPAVSWFLRKFGDYTPVRVCLERFGRDELDGIQSGEIEVEP